MKDKLEELVREMYASGVLYSHAVTEFKKRFILRVMQDKRGNQSKAARELCMHRNTLSRTIAELNLKPELRLRVATGERKKPSTAVSSAARRMATGS